jgi:hypothetical protein
VRFALLPKIHEVKPVEDVSNTDLFFSVTGVKPITGVAQDSLRIE